MSGRPLISLVVPCFNVEAYLSEFLGSLDRNLLPDVETIFVIDGATDATAQIVDEWRRTRGHRVVLIEHENRGLAEARNSGVDAASGLWVSFPDPDDILAVRYLERVRRFLSSPAAERAEIVATNLVTFNGARGDVTDAHPLRWRFRRGTRVVSMVEQPEVIHLSAATAFLRLDALRESGLRFDRAIRPTFEDGALIARFLGRVADPHIALLPGARYRYRQRSDSSSLVQSSWTRPEKYDDVLSRGYLPLLAEFEARGPIPRWLANTVIYELSWYAKRDLVSGGHAWDGDVESGQRFRAIFARTVDMIDSEVIRAYRSSWLQAPARELLLSLAGVADPHIKDRWGRPPVGFAPGRPGRVRGVLVRAWHAGRSLMRAATKSPLR